MSKADEPGPAGTPASARWVDLVGASARRKELARRDGSPGVWFGMGTMGLVGWSVVVPTLVGAALGLWLDQRHPGTHSWTLALLVAGLSLGCLNAWRWVLQQDREMHADSGGGKAGDDA
jgi:ATP synthase protein I